MESRISHTYVLPPPLFYSMAHRPLQAHRDYRRIGECNHSRKNKIVIDDNVEREEEKT